MSIVEKLAHAELPGAGPGGGEAGGYAEEARAAERAGQSTAAIRAWQLALRDEPSSVEAWSALARLHEERGARRRAAACRARLAELGQPVAPPPEPDLPEAPPRPEAPQPEGIPSTEADRVRFVHLFAGREEVHARMWRDPRRGVGYSPVHRPLSPEIVADHLLGRISAGIYLMRAGDSVTLAVLDLDASPEAVAAARLDAGRGRALRELLHREGLRMLAEARALGLDPLLVDSGYKGRHLWFFLDRETAAAAVRRVGTRLVAALQPSDPQLCVELFPRQDHLAPGGLGNLVKLPLALHLKSGRRAWILDDEGRPLAQPMERLRTISRRPLPELDRLPAAPQRPRPGPPPAPAAPARPEWSEADFDASPVVGPVLRGCAVLRCVVEGVLADKRLERSAAVALRHTLGHSPDGVRACNYLFDQVPDFPASMRLKSPLRGSPMSCARVRSRLPEIAGSLPCDCRFPEAPGRYPTPGRHLELAPPPRPAAPLLEELLDAYARQRERLRRVAEELDRLERSCAEALEAVPDRRWRCEGGEWCLEEGGALAWYPDPVEE